MTKGIRHAHNDAEIQGGYTVRTIAGRLAVATIILVALVGGASAGAAFAPLPSDSTQVNNDLTAGINPVDPVSLEDPTNADVVGGALVAGKVAVPWAIFRQRETTAGKPDQTFVRAFKSGAWSTQGVGTVGGLSSAAPTFSGSLNFDQTQDGEAPSIDFAGAGRTVPWATWYENSAMFGKDEIFASRFDNTGDANQGKWLFGGQSRGGAPGVPSLNINTNEDAVNPAIAGGSAADPTKPGPWVAWQEIGAHAPGAGKNQIFVSKPLGPGQTNCAGVVPVAIDPSAAPIGGFCWQQVGIERIGDVDPSLNVDRTRDGIEPDIAFTGANDSVPWVVWYETGNTAVGGLHNNDMVFAAKGVTPSAAPPPTGTVSGGFNWVAVGRSAQGVLDDTTAGGTCVASATAEGACSLNSDPTAGAEDPRVAAGTMTAGTPTVPWVVWDEGTGAANNNGVFVARLVSGQFVLANGGQPIGTGDHADITFSGNTPYVTWHHSNQVLSGHFATPDQFVTDNAPVGTNVSDAVRAPISSTCIATPFNQDGAACQGGATGSPFFLFSDGSLTTAKLLSDAYAPDAPATGAASGVSTSGATISGSVNPQGTPVMVHFDYGTTTAYGQSTAAQSIAPTDGAVPFAATLSGLSAGTTIHYRAVVTSDFATTAGADAVFATSSPPAPTGVVPILIGHTVPPGLVLPPVLIGPTVQLAIASKTLKALRSTGKLKLKLQVGAASTASVTGTIIVLVKGKGKRHKITRHTVSLFKPANATFTAAGLKVITLQLSTVGGQALKHLSKVAVTITARVTNRAHATTVRITVIHLK